MRAPTRSYEDPLDQIWIACAARIGLRVIRTPDAWATTDGAGTVAIASDEGLDADDCLAQMIFHELCHSLVQGPESLKLPDWGLDNQTDRDAVREHACLRLQALLTRPHGLRTVLAPTTDYRPFYDGLKEDPLEGDESSRLARLAFRRVSQPPWGPHVALALAATEQIVRTAAPFASAGSLFSAVADPIGLHRSGFPLAASGTCGGCVWRDAKGRCVQAAVKVEAALPACDRWEPALDCQQCGACCREGYDTVEISARDPVRKQHPELVETRAGRLQLRREGVRCAALEGGTGSAPYVCRIYPDRPKPCRDLAAGSTNCLLARRRVGLSR